METVDKVTCPETFKIASLMAFGCTFKLAVPVLASIYCGFNEITKASKPSYMWSFFLGHYLYGWLPHFLKTHHVLQPVPPSPLMVRYSGSHTMCNNIGDVCQLIHKGKLFNLGFFMLAKNHPEVIADDGKLNEGRSYYLIALQDGFLPIRHDIYFLCRALEFSLI